MSSHEKLPEGGIPLPTAEQVRNTTPQPTLGRLVLREYSGIPEDEIDNHVTAIVSCQAPVTTAVHGLLLIRIQTTRALNVVSQYQSSFAISIYSDTFF